METQFTHNHFFGQVLRKIIILHTISFGFPLLFLLGMQWALSMLLIDTYSPFSLKMLRQSLLVETAFMCFLFWVLFESLWAFNPLFDFLAPPSNIITSRDQNITAPAELTLNCSADGKPKPTITWTRVSDNTYVSMPLNITGGKNAESFRCTADNGIGKPLSKVVNITILCE